MAWPTPTSAGADLFHQYLAENQQQQYVNNTPHQPSASLTDHTPLANPQIQSESMSHTSSHLPQQPGPSASGPSSHSPVGYGHAQSPQAHQAAGGSGSTAPNRSMLETQRSLQARGKNYHFGSGGPQGREWEERQRRDEAE
ncbi:hypothetical protein G6011_07843 [Alternaria panax]|uniref:Uncharacterized protein n=1 Tax=Alternaria panax TaxID=48097 RepID=A0AAD4FD52_9PLEO|nr:hypothetical protein G6011_07843 [Alternaria panax]